MRKLKLFLAVCALLVSAGTQAQSWTAPTIASESPESGTQYKVMNVGAAKYLDMGKSWFGWNTTAILSDNGIKFTMTADGSNWKFIRTGTQGVFTSGNNVPGDAMHVDNTANTYGITLMPNGYYHIHDVNVTETCWGYIEYNSVWGPVAHADASTIGSYGDWAFLTDASFVLFDARVKLYNELLKAYSEGVNTDDAGSVYNSTSSTLDAINSAYNTLHQNRYDNALATASDSNPIEITEWVLTNPDFSTGNIKGWETNYVSGTQATNIGYQNNSTYSNGSILISQFIEAWRSGNAAIGDGYLRQTVENLPEGKYLLECDAIAVNQGNASATTTGALLFITADGSDYTASLSTGNGVPQHFSTNFLFTGEGNVIFGLKTVNTTANWIAADNFKVTFYGIDLSAYETQLAAEVATFEGYENSIDATIYSNLETQVNALNITYSSSKTYAAAIAKMQTINAYVAALIAANEAKGNAAYTNVTGAELTALNSAFADTPTYNDFESIASKTAALTTATSNFTTAATSYDAFISEKAHATTLGVTTFPTVSSAAEANEAINTLKVAEHNAVISKYTTDGSALFIPTWDQEGFGTPYSTEHWSGSNHEYYDKNGTNFTCKLYKTVTLPEGHYVFYAAARGATNAYASVKVTIDGTTDEVPITMKGNTGYGINTSGEADFSSSSTYANDNKGFGWEWRHIAFDLTEEKEVTIAIECGAGSSWAWVSACDTRLVTYDNIAVSKNLYETALAAATAARDNADYINVIGSELTALKTAIAENPTTKDEYEAAAEALETATSAFIAAKASYDKYAAYRAETVAAFGEELAETVAAPTTAAEAETAVQSLNIAQYNKVTNDYTYSCSGLIGDFGSWTGTATVAGEAAEPNYLDWEHWSGTTHAYYEQASSGWNNTAGWTIQYQKTCTLPEGAYVIKVAARSSAGTTSLVSCSATNVTVTLPNLGSPGRGINTSGVASWSDSDEFANGDITKEGNDPTVGGKGTGWQWRFLPFTLDAETEVTMTFYAEATTQYQWMSIADGELLSATKVAEVVSYDETDDNTIEDKLIADVTITRTIKEGYNTVVLPFTLTANQVGAAFGANTEVYNYSENSSDASDVTINFNKGDGSITANVPVLIKATAASTSQTFSGVQIVASNDVKVAGTNFDFVGTYAPVSAIAAGDYFIGNGAIYKSTGATSMNAFRAYIHAKSAGARVARFFIDGIETTGIEALEVGGTNNGKIYNMNGQEVKSAKKGLYIQNGKKVIIK